MAESVGGHLLMWVKYQVPETEREAEIRSGKSVITTSRLLKVVRLERKLGDGVVPAGPRGSELMFGSSIDKYNPRIFHDPTKAIAHPMAHSLLSPTRPVIKASQAASAPPSALEKDRIKKEGQYLVIEELVSATEPLRQAIPDSRTTALGLPSLCAVLDHYFSSVQAVLAEEETNNHLAERETVGSSEDFSNEGVDSGLDVEMTETNGVVVTERKAQGGRIEKVDEACCGGLGEGEVDVKVPTGYELEEGEIYEGGPMDYDLEEGEVYEG
ncbi:hypothetical protein BJ508DRAFT_303675 [Ascobolus immersus RN42]|uniref:Uncharacterized protein n=1 Tax=Ascobolus immersus RN42 TaxID=1160509 RepID=A0A3N4IIM8_ASCIM|nr:hypothetical protein BJ508DRAFT_303675 [Ascobolus immersus RN42]